MKADEIINKTVFTAEDRREIERQPRLRYLFLAAGLGKTTPQSLLYRISTKAWKEYYDTGLCDILDLQIVEMQEQGGKCDKCGKEWIKQEFSVMEKVKKKDKEKDEEYIITYTYEPNCKCYPRCMICNSWLIAELKTGENKCRNCKRGNMSGDTRIRCFEYVMGKDKEGEDIITGTCKGEMELLKNDHGKTVYLCSKNNKHMISYEYGFGVRRIK